MFYFTFTKTLPSPLVPSNGDLGTFRACIHTIAVPPIPDERPESPSLQVHNSYPGDYPNAHWRTAPCYQPRTRSTCNAS